MDSDQQPAISTQQQWKPLEFSYDPSTDVVTVEGLKIHADLFRALAYPRTDCAYRFERRDEVVLVTVIGSLADLGAAVEQAVETMQSVIETSTPHGREETAEDRLFLDSDREDLRRYQSLLSSLEASRG